MRILGPRELLERTKLLRQKEAEVVKREQEAAAEFQKAFRERTLTIVTTAFGVVAALFWQKAISDMINAYIPQSGVWQYELFAAVLVTVMAVTAIYFIGKWSKGDEKK
ncbi:hypothetical protein COT29_01860 [Candidatus Micrarchaeota archaeon CG08_land_8_20_14_0_20_59_11]|nr:MAG: hypothetical protein COT29_01860 [Candidatus Micrarchaeota archaeon CG08_land_8_20_14_0_20_59_11]